MGGEDCFKTGKSPVSRNDSPISRLHQPGKTSLYSLSYILTGGQCSPNDTSIIAKLGGDDPGVQGEQR